MPLAVSRVLYSHDKIVFSRIFSVGSSMVTLELIMCFPSCESRLMLCWRVTGALDGAGLVAAMTQNVSWVLVGTCALYFWG